VRNLSYVTCVLVCPVQAHSKLNAEIGKRIILLNEVCMLSLDEYFVGDLCPQADVSLDLFLTLQFWQPRVGFLLPLSCCLRPAEQPN